MDTSKVVIRLVVHGEKLYIIGLQPSSLSFKKSKNPFSDNEISKYTLEQAQEMLPTIQRWYPIGIVQIVDISGRTINNDADIHNTINEEVDKFLNEEIIQDEDDFRFTNQLKMNVVVGDEIKPQIIFQNYSSFSNDYDVNILDGYANITWKVGFQPNNNAIQNFFINIEGVEGEYRIEMRDKHTNEVVQTTDKNIADNQWKFKVDDKTTLKIGKSLFVTEVTFNFNDNLCTVKFNEQK